EGTNITADALGEGDGGTAIVWADKATAFYGNISARGGNIAGDGGFVEVSGKENLLFEGMVDVGTSFGESGTLLLDPENIRIVSNFGLNDSQLPNIQFGDDPGTTYTISKTALAAIAAIPGNNIILQATNDIIIENIGDLTFIPGTNSVTFMADGDRDGSGDFVMNDLEATIITNGRDLTISGANITAGNLNTSALTPFFFGTANGRAGGSVTITATESISTGAIDTSSNTGNAGSGDTNGGAGGMVTITATESITTGAIDTSSNILLNSSLGDTNGGAGGMVQITATNGDIQTESIKTSSISNGSSDIDGAAAGNVYLMAINGKIQTEDIDTSSISNIANSFVSPAIPATATTQTAGTIELTANNQIETGDINTSSVATVFNGIANAGMGGKTELTTNGNIQTGKIETFSTASTFNGNANAEISGTVTLNTTRGNIQTENIQTFSVARVSSGLGNANAGTGGEIEVNATRGNLQLGAIDTSTASIGVLSGTSTAGNAGQIALTSNGNLIPNTINASSTHGNGGNIVLKSSGGTIQTTGGNLNTGSLGAKGGNITLDARDDITLANFINSSGAIAGGNVIITSQSGEINGTLFAINTGDIGQTNRDAAEASSLNLPVLIPRNSENINAGDISFSALRNIRLNRGIIDASGENVFQSSVQRGSGGSISFNSGEKILFDGVRISSQTEFGTGKNIEITGRSLSANQSFIALSTNDVAQQSGNIRITAPEFIELNQDSLIQLQTEEEAIGGNITIDRTNRLTIQNSLLITLATTDNSGGAEAGKLLVNTNLLEISGTSSDGSIPSGLASLSSRQGRSGEIAVNADRIILSDGGGIAGTSAGQGFGGDITIDANIIQIDGASEGQLFSSGILADALTEGIGGNINITANELTLENGGAISTSTFGTVQGGTVDINVPEVFLTGSSANSAIKTGIYAQSFDAGNAGRIEVATANLTLENSAKISVSSDPQAEDSGNLINRTNAWINVLAARDPDDDLTADFRVARGTGNGDAGNIDISAREQIVLNDRAEIVAETSSGDGGNINMSIGNLLLLRRGSNISTTAGTAQAGGNGGNITIDVADGFVVAPPYENNDITANAFEGNGGNVTITAQAIFGLEVRDELTPLSDITASSEFGLDGTVQLNTLGIDPNNGLTNLPEDQNDPEVRQGCSRGGVNSSSLTVQGIGGAPDNPDDMLIPEFDDEFISFDELETDGTIAESDEGIEAIAPNGNQTPILFSCQ
ncbi:MAG: S-layer family protein, partial [Cyanobacteria bacterium SBLK]|nr:S-layer family protein [Cyanobacteria bacterium SBLK]